MEENQVGKKGRKERKRVREEEIEGRTEGNRHGDGEVRKNLIIFPYVGKNIKHSLSILLPFAVFSSPSLLPSLLFPSLPSLLFPLIFTSLLLQFFPFYYLYASFFPSLIFVPTIIR